MAHFTRFVTRGSTVAPTAHRRRGACLVSWGMRLSPDELTALADPAVELSLINAWPLVEGPAQPWSDDERQGFWSAVVARTEAVSGYVPLLLQQAAERLLEAGIAPPVTFQAWMLTGGQADVLERWYERFPGQLMPWRELAQQVVLKHHGGLRSPLHALVDADAERSDLDDLIDRVLAEGADPNVSDEAGRPVLAMSARLRTVQRLVAAGADPMATSEGQGVLLKAWRHSQNEVNPKRVAAWVALLSDHASPAQRPGVLFDLAQAGQPVLLDAMMGVWGYRPVDLDALEVTRATGARHPPRSWTWPGWLAFHALAGLSSTPGVLLAESIDRLKGRESALPPFDRMWLAVLNRYVDPAASHKSGSLSLRFLDAYKKQPAQPGDVGPWALGQAELPLAEGGITRTHPLRAWLVDQLIEQLQAKQPLPDTWRWSAKFLIEEAEGEQRMPAALYPALRTAVLKHALKHSPSQAPQSLPTVLLALASSLEQGSLVGNPSLPSLGAGGGVNLPGDFKAWIEADWNVATWDPALDACLKSLPERIRPDVIVQRFGNVSGNSPSNWLATWSLLGTRLHARYLEEALPGVSESHPSRRPRL